MDQQKQYRLGICYQFEFSGPAPDLFNKNLRGAGPSNQALANLSGILTMLKCKNHYSKQSIVNEGQIRMRTSSLRICDPLLIQGYHAHLLGQSLKPSLELYLKSGSGQSSRCI